MTGQKGNSVTKAVKKDPGAHRAPWQESEEVGLLRRYAVRSL